MAGDYILIVITLDLETIIVLQYLVFDHDPPICIMKEATRFIVQWPWKLTKKYM